jgi:hypothetical protein
LYLDFEKARKYAAGTPTRRSSGTDIKASLNDSHSGARISILFYNVTIIF